MLGKLCPPPPPDNPNQCHACQDPPLQPLADLLTKKKRERMDAGGSGFAMRPELSCVTLPWRASAMCAAVHQFGPEVFKILKQRTSDALVCRHLTSYWHLDTTSRSRRILECAVVACLEISDFVLRQMSDDKFGADVQCEACLMKGE